jgi:hypothetical protein
VGDLRGCVERCVLAAELSGCAEGVEWGRESTKASICAAIYVVKAQRIQNRLRWESDAFLDPCAFAGFCRNPADQVLERLYVRSLPTLGALYDVELHGLTFLQTLEPAAADCRVMHEYIFAVLARDKAEALRVIKPLHGTLFHTVTNFLELNCAGGIGANTGRILLGWASTAHARSSNAAHSIPFL